MKISRFEDLEVWQLARGYWQNEFEHLKMFKFNDKTRTFC